MDNSPMPLLSDCDLIIQLQQGNLEALGVLYDRHRLMVYRTALGITGDEETASDLLQDTFLRLHRFSQRVDPERPLNPLLYRMTVNLSYTWIKRNNRWLKAVKDMSDWFIGAHEDTPHILVEQDEEWIWVQKAVVSLPLAQRVVVVLYYALDLPLQEISDVLEVPVGTVKSRLYYGRRALKRKLGLHREMLSEVFNEFT